MHSIIRAKRIFKMFSVANELSLAHIAKELGENRTTIYRLLSSLERQGFLYKNKERALYELAPLFFELGMLYYERLGLKNAVLPYLKDLTKKTGCTTFFCIYDSATMEGVFLERVEALGPINSFARKGGRLPMHAGGAPLALLAALPNKEVQRILKNKGMTIYNDNTIATPEAMATYLKTTQERGYSLSLDDVVSGFSSIGTSILDYQGNLYGSISIASASQYFQGENLVMRAQALMEVAALIATKIGGRIFNTPAK